MGKSACCKVRRPKFESTHRRRELTFPSSHRGTSPSHNTKYDFKIFLRTDFAYCHLPYSAVSQFLSGICQSRKSGISGTHRVLPWKTKFQTHSKYRCAYLLWRRRHIAVVVFHLIPRPPAPPPQPQNRETEAPSFLGPLGVTHQQGKAIFLACLYGS